MQNKLNNEKSRLAAAVQACEAATASISRPSSPLETAMQTIPERELIVRAKLEDLLDQVHRLMFTKHKSLLPKNLSKYCRIWMQTLCISPFICIYFESIQI